MDVDLKLLQPLILTPSLGMEDPDQHGSCSCSASHGAGSGGGCKCGSESGKGA